jgi:hypothetical protein
VKNSKLSAQTDQIAQCILDKLHGQAITDLALDF